MTPTKSCTLPLSTFWISWQISSNHLHPPVMQVVWSNPYVGKKLCFRFAAMRTQSCMSVLRVCLTSKVLSISNEACHFGSFKGVFRVCVCSCWRSTKMKWNQLWRDDSACQVSVFEFMWCWMVVSISIIYCSFPLKCPVLTWFSCTAPTLNYQSEVFYLYLIHTMKLNFKLNYKMLQCQFFLLILTNYQLSATV